MKLAKDAKIADLCLLCTMRVAIVNSRSMKLIENVSTEWQRTCDSFSLEPTSQNAVASSF